MAKIDSIVLAQEERLNFISRCRRRGMREKDIIRSVKIELGYEIYTERDLNDDYELLLADWRKRKEENVDFIQMDAYMKRQALIDECWQQWEVSKEIQREREVQKYTKSRKGKGDEDEIVEDDYEVKKVKEKQGLGNPQYLYLIAQQYEAQEKLMGTQKLIETSATTVDLASAKVNEVRKIVEGFKPKAIGVKSEKSETETYIKVTNEQPIEEEKEELTLRELMESEENFEEND